MIKRFCDKCLREVRGNEPVVIVLEKELCKMCFQRLEDWLRPDAQAALR